MEHQSIEWKESWHDEYLRTVCGFANAQGGILIIGCTDSGEVVGLGDAERLLEDLPNKIRNTTGIIADVDLLDSNGRGYIRITVNPYPSPITYRGRYYYRSGSTTQELTGNSLDEFLMRKQGKTWDGVPVPNLSCDDLERDALRYFRRKATDSTRLTSADLEVDDEALLRSLILTEGKYIKRAAALLFHHNPEFWVPGAYVKIGFFANDADILYQDEVKGPLISLPDRVLDIIYHKYMKGIISYRGIQRIETYPVARSALREAVLNAVVHKDYTTGNPIQIRIYDDQVSLYNTGGLPYGWTVDSLMSNHESSPRNPLIAGVFYRAGLIEAWGRGVERMIMASREEGKHDPVFNVIGASLHVLLRDKPKSNSEPISVSEFGEKFGDRVSDTQIRIMELIHADSGISVRRIADILGITPRGAEKAVGKLKKLGLLERCGSPRSGHWIVRKHPGN